MRVKELAMARQPERRERDETEKGRMPDYIVRAKDKPGEDGRWINIGAAWDFDLRDGGTGISVRLQSLPFNWDGQLTVLPRRDE